MASVVSMCVSGAGVTTNPKGKQVSKAVSIDLVCAECNTLEVVDGSVDDYIAFSLVKFQRLCDVCIDKPDREEE
jgi:hypothetical protein